MNGPPGFCVDGTLGFCADGTLGVCAEAETEIPFGNDNKKSRRKDAAKACVRRDCLKKRLAREPMAKVTRAPMRVYQG